jgi:hypothetical protein
VYLFKIYLFIIGSLTTISICKNVAYNGEMGKDVEGVALGIKGAYIPAFAWSG